MITPCIALVCASIDNVAGGIEKQILLVASHFISNGLRTYLFTYDNPPASPFYPLPEGLVWVKCGNGLPPHEGASLSERFYQILNLRNLFIRHNISHVITFHHGLLPRSILASFFLNIVNIASERNSLSFYNYIALSKFNLGFLSLFFASKITIQIPGYKSDYPYFLRKRIHVVPNFIPNILSSYQAPNPNSKIISLVGRLEYQKGMHYLLDSCPCNLDKDVTIRIAGEGVYRSFFEQKYQAMISSGSLSLLGNVANVADFLANSAIFCFPSLWEGYPNALLEALRQGLPIVTTHRMKHLVDFVEHRVNGLIVHDRDLYTSCLLLISDQSLYRKLSFNSYLKYKELSSCNPMRAWLSVLNMS